MMFPIPSTFVALLAFASVGINKVSALEYESSTHFNIQLHYLVPPTADVKAIFDSAKARWESVLISDIGTAVTVQQGQVMCGVPAPQTELIDDLLIYVHVAAIDGPGNVLARAGPCATDSQGKIRVGFMEFDLADILQLIATNRANVTVLHEMGHVLGFGTLWSQKGLIGEPADSDHVLRDYKIRYLGEQGNIGNEEVGMKNEAVVEDSGGVGTANSHWEEDIYQDELMTGFVPSSGVAPLSRLTIRSLADLGYLVDPDQAEEFEVDQAIVDGLQFDLKESAASESKNRLRGRPKSNHGDKQGYGEDVIQVPLITLESKPKRRRQ
jgi:hypothetical protein